MANEFNIKNGFISRGNGIINGDLTVTSISAATYYNLPPSGISGSGSTGQIAFFNTSSSLSGSSKLNWDDTNKRLGIVTSSPLAKLHVVSDDFGQDLFRVTYAAGSIDMINVKSGGYGTGTITLTSPDGVVCNSNLKMGYNNIIGATNSYIKLESPAGGNQSMYFKTSSASNDLGFQFLNSSDNQVFQITNGGNVGIGTTTPTEKLEVNGKTKTTNFQMTSGATNGYVLTSDSNGNSTWQPATITTLSSTTATIHFTGNTVFGTYSSPISSNLTDTLTNAKLGVVQKIYHNSGTAPTVPAGWVLLGSTTYQTSTVNIIYAEWSEGTRVEYWIVR